MKELLQFLQSQRTLTIGTVDSNGEPWNTTVYFSVNEKGEFFFLSALDAKHAKHIKQNSKISFSVAWFDENDLSNRKGIQGSGTCMQVSDSEAIASHLENHYQYSPSWKETINLKSIAEGLIKSKPFIIKPKYIKFWNDELHKGSEGDPIKEFKF